MSFGSKKTLKRAALVLSVASISLGVSAQEHEVNEDVLAKFKQLIPLEIKAVEKAPIDGLTQVVTERGLFYLTPDGKYIIAGNIHEAKPGLKNLTKERANREIAEKLDSLKGSFITYESPNQKHEVVVFYDSSCPWCRRQHSELDSYLDAGITVHYAAWPRQGVKSPKSEKFTSAYYKLENIWCSDDPSKAFNEAAENKTISRSSCDNEIEAHFELGRQMGVTGTPATYTLDGSLVAKGFSPAEQMKEALGE